jgi:hypothetical protein
MALSKAQTVVLTLLIAAIPVAHSASQLCAARAANEQAKARLIDANSNLALAETDYRRAKARMEQSSTQRDTMAQSARRGPKLEVTRIVWIDGLAYTRIPKSFVASIPRSGLDSKWKPPRTLSQILALTSSEEGEISQALTDYAAEISRQNESHLKRVPNDPSDEGDADTESKTFEIGPRHDDAVAAARSLEASIRQILDPERARIALKQFSLPLLPGGTTDYESFPDVDNSVSNTTAISQGLPCRIVFSRDRNPGKSRHAYAQITFTSPHGGKVSNGQGDFTDPVMPASLEVFWQNWKAGKPESQP